MVTRGQPSQLGRAASTSSPPPIRKPPDAKGADGDAGPLWTAGIDHGWAGKRGRSALRQYGRLERASRIVRFAPHFHGVPGL